MRRVMDMHEIRTKRLLLRPFRESDYDDLFEFLSQLADDEFEGYPGIIYENGQEHLKYRLGSEEFYAIELTESGKVIGNIYCGNKDFAAKEVGYIVNKRYQKKGYANEALSAVIAQVFREGAHRVFAECPVVEAAGEGGLAAGGTFQAKYLVPQERKRCACLEGYTDLCDTGKRYGSVKMHENKPDGIL